MTLNVWKLWNLYFPSAQTKGFKISLRLKSHLAFRDSFMKSVDLDALHFFHIICVPLYEWSNH